MFRSPRAQIRSILQGAGISTGWESLYFFADGVWWKEVLVVKMPVFLYS